MVGGEDPLVVLCEGRHRVKNPTATLVVANAESLRSLLELLLGSSKVTTHAQWIGRQRRQAASSAQTKRLEVTDARLTSGLRSVLRGVLGQRPVGQLRISLVKKIQLDKLEKSELTRVERKGKSIRRVLVNQQHPLWKATAQAARRRGATPIKHLAAALLVAWSRRPHELISTPECIQLLTLLADGSTPE